MRKTLTLLLSIILISSLFLAACGKKTDNAGETTTPSTTTTPGGSSGDVVTPEPAEEPDALGFIPASDKSRIPAASKARGSDTMVLGMQNTNGVFSPFYYVTAYDNYVVKSVVQSLAIVSQDASWVPQLATWETSADGLIWTFHIDPNAKFSDGTPVTAEDAEFSYYVYLDPNFDGRLNMLIPKIVGSEAYKNGDATTIEGVKVIDEKTLQVTVEEVNSLTLNYLAVPVVPKAYYGEGFTKGDNAKVHTKNAAPIGSGPWKLVDYLPGQEVRLVANENYWKPAEVPKIKNLIFKATDKETQFAMLEAGETDFEEGISVNKDNMEMLESMGFVDQNLLLNNGYGYIAMNNENPKFQDKRVRQALVYGLDRESAVFAYSQGYANVIDVPQSQLSWAYPDESKITHYDFSLEKAGKLLDEAGWVMGADGYRYKDGEKFVINYAAISPHEVNEALVPIAIENYKELGIELVAELLEFGTVSDKFSAGDYEMLFIAVGLVADPDPYGLFHTNGGSNNYRYSNPEVDRLIEAGQKELNQEKRKEIYNELYQIINDEVPIILMYQRYNLNSINARLSGFDITPYYDFSRSTHQVTAE